MASLSAPAQPNGTELQIRMGGVSYRLVAETSDVEIELSPIRSRFASAPSHDGAEILVRRGDLRRRPWEPGLSLGPDCRMRRDGERTVFDFIGAKGVGVPHHPYKQLSVAPSCKEAVITVDGGAMPPGVPIDPLEAPLDEILGVTLLGAGSGIELHASAAGDPGRSWVFVGHSGRGKTTLANLVQEDGAMRALADDRAVIGCGPTGYQLFGVPWDPRSAEAPDLEPPLEAILFLEHGHEERLEPLGRTEAVAALMGLSLAPRYDPRAVEASLTFLEGLASTVACFRLWFRPTAEAVSFLEREL